MDAIKAKAETFTLSYKKAMELSLSDANSLTTCADAIASHYAPQFYNFSFGSVTILPDAFPGATHTSIVARHLQNYVKSGLGYRISLTNYSIHPYSETSAQCWLTWSIEPQNEEQGWQWTNIYGYRVLQDGKGVWESAVADHEIGELLKRCPTFMELSN